MTIEKVEQFLSTPSARRATFSFLRWISGQIFLSTPSARRATRCAADLLQQRPISIHALREEGDLPPSRWSRRGQRFLSTPSARRATCPAALPQHHLPISIHALREEGDQFHALSAVVVIISIHALREEGDPLSTINRNTCLHFYPRPPRGGRRRETPRG